MIAPSERGTAEQVKALADRNDIHAAASAAGISADELARSMQENLTADQLAATLDHPDQNVSTDSGVTAQGLGLKCGKAWAAYGLYQVWGMGLCAALAAGSLPAGGAAGIACDLIHSAGGAAIDWNQACK